MKILNFEKIENWTEPTVLVLGYFDGLHLGHQKLFREAQKIAAKLNLKITVFTFPEKPTLIFEKYNPDMLLKLTSDKKRAELFEENGVDYLVFKDFTSSFAKLTLAEFETIIIKKFSPLAVVTGSDYTAGSDIKKLSLTDKYKLIVVPELTDSGAKISSTRIRKAIKSGNIAKANKLLGYPFEITGLVVHGFARGRSLGYPTANLIIKDYVHIPSSGVYTVDVFIRSERHRGFASIGSNETFNAEEKTIEVHVFDFELDIYGEQLTVLWLDKIREMKKFDKIEDLVKQMKSDELKAREWKKD